jgi:hypothetical protein
MQIAKILISTAAAAALLAVGAGQASAKHHVRHHHHAAQAAAPGTEAPGGVTGAPNNFPKNASRHRDTSHSDTR